MMTMTIDTVMEIESDKQLDTDNDKPNDISQARG